LKLPSPAHTRALGINRQKKSHPKVAFLEAEKITSSRRQERQQVQQRRQQVREQQQELQQQVREQQQELQQQVREGLLFCHKRPEQRPTELPRGVIFSWGYFL